MIKLTTGKIISFLILLITVYSINQWAKFNIGNTFFWWIVDAFVLIEFIRAKRLYYDTDNNRDVRFLYWFLTWNIICVIRGLFVAENYWEWKDLTGNAMMFLMPLSLYIATNKNLMQSIIGSWFKYALPVFFFFIPIFAYPDAMGRYLVPISFISLFFPVLTKRWQIITLFFTALVILGALDARSNVIKFSMSMMLSCIYFIRKTILVRYLEVLRWCLLLVPVILFSLALSGVFNVFRMDEYLSGDYTTTVVEDGQARETNLIVDTRTFLYEEVLSSAVKYKYIWFGRTPARGNESASFGEFALEVLKTGKMERSYNEVAILNVFTWTGVIGVVLYFLVFYRASYLAVTRSSNIFMKILGICVAFRWTYGWVEDYSLFDLSYFYLWIMIGMCFSKSFREMDDWQMRYWILGIFDKRYRQIDLIEPDADEEDKEESIYKNDHPVAVLHP